MKEENKEEAEAGTASYACTESVVSDSVRPHRRQLTRLPRPWDPPGKNTEVGCHFLLQCMKVKSESEVAQPRTILMLGLVIIKTDKVSTPTEITF